MDSIELKTKNPEHGIGTQLQTQPTSPIQDQATDSATQTPTVYKPGEHRRILRNIVVISLAFALLMSGFHIINNLQSSLNNDIPGEEGVGTYSQATLYIMRVISSMFIAPYFIQLVKCKWAVVISMSGYVFYIAAQYYPTFFTLIPTAALIGFCSGPLWAAKCTYLTHVGREYARITGQSPEAVIARFFSIFFFFYQSRAIWGNLLSSLVLDSAASVEVTVGGNGTAGDEDLSLGMCGANFCPDTPAQIRWLDLTDSNSWIYEPDTNSGEPAEDMTPMYIVIGACLAFVLLAVLVMALFVDSMARYGEGERAQAANGRGKKLVGRKLAIATFAHMLNPRQLLIIPVTVYAGLEQGFLTGDISRAYITCSWGIDKIGWTFMCYGIVSSIGSLVLGPAVRVVGRIPVVLFGTLVTIGLLATLLFWSPTPDEPLVFFAITGLWGLADSIWQTQINSFYGILFRGDEEAAYSNYRLWESVGFIISYVSTNLVCMRLKIYFLYAWLAVSVVGYLAVEVGVRLTARRERDGDGEKK